MADKKYTAEDLALDERFQKWVFQPDPDLNSFWQHRIKKLGIPDEQIKKAIELVTLAGLSGDAQANRAFLEVWGNLKRETERIEVKRSIARYRYVGFAAAFLALAVALLYMFSRVSESRGVEYRTDYGESREIRLADGSKVLLNANSTLTVPEDFSGSSAREVVLSGEAFFEIVKTQDQKRFVVHPHEQVEVEVLGTSFNVNTRREKVEVYLQSGRVKFQTPGRELIMEPGDLAHYELTGRSIQLDRQPDFSETRQSWRENVFDYDDARLQEIVMEIEEYYGLQVIVADSSLLQQRFTGKVSRKDKNVFFKVLSEALKVDIRQTNDRVVIRNLQTTSN